MTPGRFHQFASRSALGPPQLGASKDGVPAQRSLKARSPPSAGGRAECSPVSPSPASCRTHPAGADAVCLSSVAIRLLSCGGRPRGLAPRPTERGAVGPQAVHDHREPARHRHPGAHLAAPPGRPPRPNASASSTAAPATPHGSGREGAATPFDVGLSVFQLPRTALPSPIPLGTRVTLRPRTDPSVRCSQRTRLPPRVLDEEA